MRNNTSTIAMLRKRKLWENRAPNDLYHLTSLNPKPKTSVDV